MRIRRLPPLLAALAVLLVPASPASAHASLLAATPGAGYSVAHSPSTLTLVFDQPVSVRGTPLRVTGPGGGAVALDAPRLSNGARWLSARVLRHLADGQYSVTWQVVADDGDVVGGSYSFGVGAGVVAPTAHGDVTRGLAGAAVLRWLLFAALSLALGGLVGQRVATRVIRKAAAVGRELAPVRAPVAAASAVGAVAAIGLGAHLLGSGNIATGLIHLSIPALWASDAGRVNAIEVAAFALAAVVAVVAARADRPRLHAATVLALLAVVAAEGRRSHLREIDGALGVALLVVHLAAAAIWLGALSHVLTVAWRWRAHRAAAHRVLAEYAKLALGLLLLVAATGSVSAVVALPRFSALGTTGYGRLLIAKIVLVVAVVGFAVTARHRLRRPAPAPAEQQPARAARTERILLGAVLAVTALLVSVALPGAPDTSALALPPPPVGPVVRLATLDGELTVGVTASDGQVELRTSVPDPSGDGARRTAELSATLGGPTSARPVILRRCGPGCFVGPVQWTRGANTLRVAASAKPWTGGTALFRVPWPPVADSRLLAQVIAAMRAVPKVVVHEAVTSDTAGPSPIVNTNTLTGPDFVSVEPYGKDGTLQVVVVGRDAGMTEIAFALLDQDYYFQLKVGADHRIAGEVISTPQHLYTRTFDYPAARRR